MRRWLPWLVMFVVPLAVAGNGAGELTLDRGAVAAILSANLPDPIKLSVPGLGAVSIHISPPVSVRFVEGGVDVMVGLAVEPLGLQGEAALRYVPEIDEKSGMVRFRAQKATLGGALAGFPDLAGFFPPLELPRSFDWTAQSQASSSVRMTIAVQGVVVEKDRVVLKLGLVTRPLTRPGTTGSSTGK